MNEMSVPFMIWGNPISNAGYNAIFYFNNPTFTAPGDTSPQGMGDNDFFFTVNISQAFTNIVLIQNHVTSADSSRGGRLKFAMSIPKGYRLANGATPYEVLTEMRNLFVTQYMDPARGDGAFRYKFRMTTPPPQALEAVLARYRYVPASLPHRVMRGQVDGFLRVPADKMHDLFSDLQYAEFQPYRQIVIAEHGELNPHVGVAGIPRPVKWSLSVNGTLTNWPAKRPDESYVIAVPNKSPRYWENAEIRFRLKDAAAGTVPGVTPDFANETINVRLNPIPRQRVYKISIQGASPAEIRHITFVAGNHTIPCDGNQIVLKGEDIDIKPTARYNGYDYTLEGSGVNGDTLVVTLRKKARGRANAGGVQGGMQSGQSDQPIALQIVIACGKDSRNFQDAKVIVDAYAGAGRMTYSEHPMFYADNSHGEAISATINVPGYFLGQQAEVKIKSSKGKASTRYTISKENQPIEFRQESIEKASIFGNISSLIAIILTVGALMIGGVAGWFVKGYLGGDEKEKREQTDNNNTDSDTDDEWYKDQKQWEEIEAQLNDPDLQFSTVQKLNEDVKAVKENKELEEIASVHSSVIERLENYTAVINAIKSGTRADEVAKMKDKLNPVHANMLMSISEGWVDEDGNKHYYTAEDAKKACEQFQAGSNGYTSFRQIDDIHQGKHEYSNDPRQNESNAGNPARNSGNRGNTGSGNNNGNKPKVNPSPRSGGGNTGGFDPKNL